MQNKIDVPRMHAPMRFYEEKARFKFVVIEPSGPIRVLRYFASIINHS